MDPKLAASITNFAARFCNEQDKGSSSVCSPVSAQAVLALTALGCAGASRAELLRAMDLTDDDHIRSLFGYVLSTLKSVEDVTLKIANRVYVTNDERLKPSLLKDAEEVFDSGLQQLDFKDQSAAANAINEWVADQTSGMIKDIVSRKGMPNDSTSVLLVNAIYFQGFWELPFRKSSTRNRPFYTNNTTEIKVPMMFNSRVHNDYKHSPELKAKILKLNYKGRQASMVIVLPDEVEGLGDVMQQLAAGHDLMDEIAGLKSTLVDVMIPKFKLENDINLTELLDKMGIKTIFDRDHSEIRMLASGSPMFVSKALQKAFIEVDEAGTKAAVRTKVECEVRLCRRSEPEVVSFIADRPFLYFLTVRQIPVFVGIYEGSEFAVSEATIRKKPVSAGFRPDLVKPEDYEYVGYGVFPEEEPDQAATQVNGNSNETPELEIGAASSTPPPPPSI